MLSEEVLVVNVTTTPYIAGSDIGIVTVAGTPAARHIYLLDTITLTVLRHTVSLSNGHYIFNELDASIQYIVMCRDLPPDGVNQRYEPVAWDYVTPATDLTIAEQQELWQSWQTST